MWNSSPAASPNNNGGGARRKGKGRASAFASSGGFDEEGALKMFEDMCDEDDCTVAGMEGISKLCTLLSLDPYSDIRVLVLLWKLGASKKPAEIQREEWMAGCHRLNFDSLEKLRGLVPSLDMGFLDMEEFKDFYKFCFQFNRQGTHKTLDKDLVVALLKMTLADPPRIPTPRLTSFCDFLEQSTDESYAKITLDQWRSFLDFSLEFGSDEELLSGYDEGESAWPVLIDEYVEFVEKMSKGGKK
ncbi:predicted protein [Thalassiosira pseudonana CCMP1335]|uniref:Defective in cullin neddylation protein n=1 Tax=Thalassiosira pseudonana TaxID=35128 RepID=B8CDZ1_THAPS|nr:predicted protein [Thalassiosira pseudonana CCMP1335]EED88179.1 predicted protein [Thalassiosira pseudonana CCMP1335]